MDKNRSTALRRLMVVLAHCGSFLIAAGPAARAQSGSTDEAAIRDALSKWTTGFNARDASHICDLFAPDLVYDYRGFPERGHDALCALLQRSLADRTRTFTYSLDIKEIIVSGELAVVRLVWTLRVTSAGDSKAAESKEPGLDVFRREPDGRWRIIRYIAYEAP